MKYEYNRLKYIRVQRLMNIRMAKAFRTTSSEALCILAVMTPIIIKKEEAVKQYNIRKGKETKYTYSTATWNLRIGHTQQTLSK